ncbi:hypothetical protein A4R44_00450 [Amycolatopsis sp. M39]|nr:hypothetical protein A4R44_00450 [Amycolatopsis sp. M39]
MIFMPTADTTTIRQAMKRKHPKSHVRWVRFLDKGYTSKQCATETEDGSLLAKVPQRDRDSAQLRRLVASARKAAECGIPVARYRNLVPHEPALGG